VKASHEWFVVDQNIDRDALTFNYSFIHSFIRYAEAEMPSEGGE
jgi:hypothetical protein